MFTANAIIYYSQDISTVIKRYLSIIIVVIYAGYFFNSKPFAAKDLK